MDNYSMAVVSVAPNLVKKYINRNETGAVLKKYHKEASQSDRSSTKGALGPLNHYSHDFGRRNPILILDIVFQNFYHEVINGNHVQVCFVDWE